MIIVFTSEYRKETSVHCIKQSYLSYMSKDTQSFFMSTTLFIFSLFLEILYDVLFSTMFALSTNVGPFSHMLGTYHLVYRKNDRNSWSTIYRNPNLSWCTNKEHVTHTHTQFSFPHENIMTVFHIFYSIKPYFPIFCTLLGLKSSH
jgi:hypothetical protein